MNGDLISREALLKELCEGCNGAKKKGCGNPCCDYELIELAPAVDAEPVRHGRWIGTSFGTIKCSLCGSSYNIYKGFAEYCAGCGAKMDLEVSDEAND